MYSKIAFWVATLLGLSFWFGVYTVAYAHEMTPTYPKWSPSYVDGVMQTSMEMFNKRQDVEYYEVGIFDSEWEPVPFVSSYKLLRLRYLGHVKFDLYIRREDVKRAEYVCSKSKLRSDDGKSPLISSRICSRFK